MVHSCSSHNNVSNVERIVWVFNRACTKSHVSCVIYLVGRMPGVRATNSYGKRYIHPSSAVLYGLLSFQWSLQVYLKIQRRGCVGRSFACRSLHRQTALLRVHRVHFGLFIKLVLHRLSSFSSSMFCRTRLLSPPATRHEREPLLDGRYRGEQKGYHQSS